MGLKIERQIADVLSVAIEQLACCEAILDYPKKYSKHYAPGSIVDNFWMNASKTFFYESLLLTETLLNKDPRTISFFNWTEFFKVYAPWLKEMAKEFRDSGLENIRDQVVGHIDASNHNNQLPRQRRQGTINELLVQRLKKIQQNLVEKFDEFTRNKGTPYHLTNYFGGGTAKEEAESVLSGEKPKLTSDPVI